MITILITGGGGREHALAWALKRSGLEPEVLVGPGNGGTASIAENVAVDLADPTSILRVVRERKVDLVVLGPDQSVAAGVADACAEARVPCCGPTAAAGRIESSKLFARELMDEAGIAAPRWTSGGRADRDALAAFVTELGGACVVKADGLALGKGVVVCDTAGEALAAIDERLLERRFGAAGDTVLVEERLTGREISAFAITDGEAIRMLPSACDYKRAHDGDSGPNTGGMGAYAPPPFVDATWLTETVREAVIRPAVDALRHRGTPFRGCLYAGLMLTDTGLAVIEFNARFGDPETQVILPLVADDLVEICSAAAVGGLGEGAIRTHSGSSVGVVLASGGYPGEVSTGQVIHGLAGHGGRDREGHDVHVFHAGTARDADGSVRTAGGRVLTVVGHGHDLASARSRAYERAHTISFDGMRMRHDIAALGAGQESRA